MLEMQNRTWQFLAGLIGLAGIGCGADPGASDDMVAARDEVSAQAVPVLEERGLAELESGDERHIFVLLGEEPNAVVSHRILGSAGE